MQSRIDITGKEGEGPPSSAPSPMSRRALLPLLLPLCLSSVACEGALSRQDGVDHGVDQGSGLHPGSGDMHAGQLDMAQGPDDGSHPVDPDMRGPTQPDGPIEPLPICSNDDEVEDQLDAKRLLRKASFILTGAPPTYESYAQLEALPDEEARIEHVMRYIEEQAYEPAFYEQVFEMARTWFNVPFVQRTADAPEYAVPQQGRLFKCKEDTIHAGKYVLYRTTTRGACEDPDAATLIGEAWWAPGEMVEFVGQAAHTHKIGKIRNMSGNYEDIDCEQNAPQGDCGCGPKAIFCVHNFGSAYAGSPEYSPNNAFGHRRMLSEEPARMFAHLAWHNKPATDLILGDYLVGPTRIQASYIMHGLRAGDRSQLHEDSWWNPASSKFQSALRDPLHTAPDDQHSWREYKPHEFDSAFLSDRHYTFDPRTTREAMEGLPVAGILTGFSILAAYPRERLRAARMMETLACDVFDPPSAKQQFNEYTRDPATEGTCQHCHARLDPAAIHFKRFGKRGHGGEGCCAEYMMPGIDTWVLPDGWRAENSQQRGEPYSQWRRWYEPDTVLTPVTQAEVDFNDNAVFIDFLPSGQTLYGQESDGTVGPLGFARMIVNSGAFDRCVVNHIHHAVMGRPIDPANESGYLDSLTAHFVSQDRNIRKFWIGLMKSELFRRGI